MASIPDMDTVPRVGRRIPAARSSSVDFPEPFLPRRPVIVPGLKVWVMLCSAQFPQRCLYPTLEKVTDSLSSAACSASGGSKFGEAGPGVEDEETVILLLKVS